MDLLRSLLVGTIAGAAGTVALDLTSYADMAIRGRSPSSVPSELVKRLAARYGISALTADDEKAANRRSAVGAMLGYANGMAVGALFGVVRSLAHNAPPPAVALAAGGTATAVADVPIAATGVSDPRTWGVSGWLSDLIPHAAYGFTVVGVYDMLSPSRNSTSASTSNAQAIASS